MVAEVDADAGWGILVSRRDLSVAERADALCREVIEHLGAPGAAHTSNSGEFDSYLLTEDDLLQQYILKADGEVNSAFGAVIPRKLTKAFLRYSHGFALG